MPTAERLPALADRLPIGGSAIQTRLAEAAIELFYQQGALATTVRDITAACGMTPGALYNHFASKDHLLFLLVRDIHLQADGGMAAVLAAAGEDPIVQLGAAVRYLVSHTARYKKRSRVANREFTLLTGPRRLEVTGLRRQLRDRFARILLAGAQQGSFSLVGGSDPVSATLTAATISTMCVRISEWTLENYPLALSELEDHYAELALRMVGVGVFPSAGA
ncbi:MAG TPA: TetR/AcrR family transcriptional regulator [Streptosporangiaceae bacterium]|jgi:AcrR family transcriptional regulator